MEDQTIKVGFVDMVRASMIRLLQQNKVEVPEQQLQAVRVARAELSGNEDYYYTVVKAFLQLIDSFEMQCGAKVEGLFDDLYVSADGSKLELAREFFNDPDFVRDVMKDMCTDVKKSTLSWGTLMAAASFLNHICLQSIKLDVNIESDMMDRLLGTLTPYSELEHWNYLCEALSGLHGEIPTALLTAMNYVLGTDEPFQSVFEHVSFLRLRTFIRSYAYARLFAKCLHSSVV